MEFYICIDDTDFAIDIPNYVALLNISRDKFSVTESRFFLVDRTESYLLHIFGALVYGDVRNFCKPYCWLTEELDKSTVYLTISKYFISGVAEYGIEKIDCINVRGEFLLLILAKRNLDYTIAIIRLIDY